MGPYFGFWDQTFGPDCPLHPPPKTLKLSTLLVQRAYILLRKKNVWATDSENICKTLKFTHFLLILRANFTKLNVGAFS